MKKCSNCGQTITGNHYPFLCCSTDCYFDLEQKIIARGEKPLAEMQGPERHLVGDVAERIPQEDGVEEAKPLPCPFCGDPMRINNAKLITHAVRPTTCIIGDLVWDESHAEHWNIRHNVLAMASPPIIKKDPDHE